MAGAGQGGQVFRAGKQQPAGMLDRAACWSRQYNLAGAGGGVSPFLLPGSDASSKDNPKQSQCELLKTMSINMSSF